MMRRVWQESSVEKFGTVNEKRKEVGKDETTRGESLRDLQRFFKKYDENKGYAGLRRIADEDGNAVWTILEESEVPAQLKMLTKMRQREAMKAAAKAELAKTEREAEAEDLTQTIALITQPDAAGAAQGLNDNAHGIDRFGYRARCLLPPTMHCLFLLHTLTFPPARHHTCASMSAAPSASTG